MGTIICYAHLVLYNVVVYGYVSIFCIYFLGVLEGTKSTEDQAEIYNEIYNELTTQTLL